MTNGSPKSKPPKRSKVKCADEWKKGRQGRGGGEEATDAGLLRAINKGGTFGRKHLDIGGAEHDAKRHNPKTEKK